MLNIFRITKKMSCVKVFSKKFPTILKYFILLGVFEAGYVVRMLELMALRVFFLRKEKKERAFAFLLFQLSTDAKFSFKGTCFVDVLA